VLLVLGGTIVATVAAWLISSASAGADTLPSASPDSLPTAGEPTGLSSLLAPIDALVRSVAPQQLPSAPPLPTPSTPSPDDWRRVAHELVSRLGGHLPVDGATPVAVLAPAQPVLRSVVGQPAVAPAFNAVAVQATGVVSAAQPVASAVVGHAVDRITTPRSFQAAGQDVPSAPVLPSRQPGCPVGMPAAPGTGGGTAQNTSGLNLIDHVDSPARPHLDALCVVPLGTSPGTVSAGKQPGTTPD
jgi:hypothetical protein